MQREVRDQGVKVPKVLLQRSQLIKSFLSDFPGSIIYSNKAKSS